MAYLDPGAAYIAIQGLLGLGAGLSAALIAYRGRVVDVLRSRRLAKMAARTRTGREAAPNTREPPLSPVDASQDEDAEAKSALP